MLYADIQSFLLSICEDGDVEHIHMDKHMTDLALALNQYLSLVSDYPLIATPAADMTRYEWCTFMSKLLENVHLPSDMRDMVNRSKLLGLDWEDFVHIDGLNTVDDKVEYLLELGNRSIVMFNPATMLPTPVIPPVNEPLGRVEEHVSDNPRLDARLVQLDRQQRDKRENQAYEANIKRRRQNRLAHQEFDRQEAVNARLERQLERRQYNEEYEARRQQQRQKYEEEYQRDAVVTVERQNRPGRSTVLRMILAGIVLALFVYMFMNGESIGKTDHGKTDHDHGKTDHDHDHGKTDHDHDDHGKTDGICPARQISFEELKRGCQCGIHRGQQNRKLYRNTMLAVHPDHNKDCKQHAEEKSMYCNGCKKYTNEHK